MRTVVKNGVMRHGCSPTRAVEKAETFVRRHRSDTLGLVLASTRWRRAPASEKQLQILRTRGIEAPDALTKGQASHLIGMLPPPGGGSGPAPTGGGRAEKGEAP
jgi:hypothetical protein